MAKRNAVESRPPDLQDITFRPAHARLPDPPITTLRAERRNVAARKAIVRRVRSEFEEMPGLSLTLVQAMRLFGVSADAAARMLQGLAEEGVLHLTADGRYVRHHERP